MNGRKDEAQDLDMKAGVCEQAAWAVCAGAAPSRESLGTERIMRRLTITCLALIGHSVLAQDFAIDSFSRNGNISWPDHYTTGHYRVQWCSDLASGEWDNDWSSLYAISATGGTITASVPMFYRVLYFPQTNTVAGLQLRLVPGGGQPGGPIHDFYMSTFEITEAFFIQFLNDAEANAGGPKGANMYFHTNGDVYMDSSQTALELLFDISNSMLLYNKNSSLGSRYSGFPDRSDHPVTGVGWFGAVKFCNWLTLHSGRGQSQRCYSEGTSTGDWHPANISAAEWVDGFENSARMDWANNYTGFRLPMDQYSNQANYFNEFYKAAAWNGTNNTVYPWGRDTLEKADSNMNESDDPFETREVETTPVGYYDGSDHGGEYSTRTNGNFYGIHDLGGNVWEWQNDSYNTDRLDMAKRGGSWEESYGNSGFFACTYRLVEYKHETFKNLGFRVVTTFAQP